MISPRNDKKQHKLKTGIEELAEPLLKQLDSCPKDAIVGEVCRLVVEKKNIVERRQQWDSEQISLFGKIERYIDYWKENKGESELLENFKKLVEEQGVDLSTVVTITGEEEENFSPKDTILEVGKPSNNNIDQARENFSENDNSEDGQEDDDSENGQEEDLEDGQGDGDSEGGEENDDPIKLLLEKEYIEDGETFLPLREFLYSLTVFPEDTKIKKRTLVSWWIGSGLSLPNDIYYHLMRKNIIVRQPEDVLFSFLVLKGILKPVHTRIHNGDIDSVTIDPNFYRKLKYFYKKRKQEVVIDENENVKRESSCGIYCDEKCDVRPLLNVDQKYINSKEIINIFEKEKGMKVVQLGRWRCITEDEKIDSTGNKSRDHIVVEDTDFLKRVGKNVRYISLQDISNIDALPESIGKLGDLRILDLRSCHNLEKLPQRRRMSKYRQGKWFDNLSHLDISDCYLLDHIPKWICELHHLQVLKGFVVGSGGKKKKSCRLHDLVKLKLLRKLSIRIGKFLDPEDASGLKLINWLSVLTVTWSINDNEHDNDKLCTISFPESLEKLDIRCYPEDEVVEFLNPEALPNLERLYIRGGRLKRLTIKKSNWKVKKLRLKFLKHLEFDWNDLGGIFPSLEHVEYKQCPFLLFFPRNRTAWNTMKDGPIAANGPLTMMACYDYETTLVENKKKMMILLKSDHDGFLKTPKLDLVVVLDVSGSTEAVKNLEYTKAALLFVIKTLRNTDSLSIVTFSTEATKLQPLQEKQESSQKDLEYLVNSLKPDHTKTDGTTNIFDGLQMGLDILKNRPNINGSENFAAIILVSNGKQSSDTGEAAVIPIGDVAVHTFGLGNYHDPLDLSSIAYKSMGGTFSYLKKPSQLTQAIGQCLDGLLTVIAQDLTLTITPIEKSSTMEWASSSAEYYPQIKHNEAGSATLKFGYLSNFEVRKVVVNLLLPAGAEGLANVLQVSSLQQKRPLPALKNATNNIKKRQQRHLATLVKATGISVSGKIIRGVYPNISGVY